MLLNRAQLLAAEGLNYESRWIVEVKKNWLKAITLLQTKYEMLGSCGKYLRLDDGFRASILKNKNVSTAGEAVFDQKIVTYLGMQCQNQKAGDKRFKAIA